jgi:hypothetical protein
MFTKTRAATRGRNGESARARIFDELITLSHFIFIFMIFIDFRRE